VEEPQTPLGFASLVGDTNNNGIQDGGETIEWGVYQFTTPVLADGSHFLTARVQMLDPATPLRTGFGDRSLALEIVVDTVAPPVFFGSQADLTDGLVPDPGVIPQPPFFVDNKTSDQTPEFWGTAEANSIIRVYADLTPTNNTDNFDVLLALTVALPEDGTNQFPNGQWRVASNIDLNDPAFFAVDGLRRILVTAEDLAGNVNPGGGVIAQRIEIFLDTQGPQVTDVFITADPAFDLFDLKPTPRPTPLVPQLSITVRDLPARIALFPNPALNPVVAVNPGHFLLVGDYNGIIPITSITFTPNPVVPGQAATGTIVLTFAEPLPDDRFTLTLSDQLVDDVGNGLDGESNASQPLASPTFPSGDGQPGGDFVARFTVDSRPEIGVWASGVAWIDTNGNEAIDPRNADFVNRDIIYPFGVGNSGTDRAFTSDDFFAGNFRNPGPDGRLGTADDGPADGFDKLAVYGSTGQGIAGPWRFLVDGNNDGVPDIIDTNGNGASDVQSAAGVNFNGIPVAGNFAPTPGDEVGIFTGTTWYFDINGDFQLDAGSAIVTAMRGYPIVGDFDGNGVDDLATWADDVFQFDLNRDGIADATINFGFIGVRERPLAADLDKDGIDDIGLWSPDLSGITPNEGAEWFFLVSNDPTGANRVAGTVNTLDHTFKPVPFGKDRYMQLGTSYSIPIVGNFDPPATEGVVDLTEEEVTSVLNRLDVNKDGYVTPIDALIVINKLNTDGAQSVFTGVERLLDVNGDGTVAPSDVLAIINYLSANNLIQAEGEGSSAFSTGLTADSVAANSSNYIEVADGQLLAAADTMRLVFAPIAPVSRGLDELFARLDNADHNPGNADGDQASSIDALLAAFSSDELFDAGNSADRDFGSVMDELLSDDDLLDVNRLAADVLSTYITDK
jgi:hypothetical protein